LLSSQSSTGDQPKFRPFIGGHTLHKPQGSNIGGGAEPMSSCQSPCISPTNI